MTQQALRPSTTYLSEFLPSANVTITGTFQDEYGEAVPLASLATVTVTLYDAATRTIINNRNAQDVKNTNGGTVAADGSFELTLSADDNAIFNGRLEAGVELRVVQIVWTWTPAGGGTRTGRAEYTYGLTRLSRVS